MNRVRDIKTLFSTKGVFILRAGVWYNIDERGRVMTVYIEYAFLQNFLLDGILLALSLFAARVPTRAWRILLSACIGGVFALLFPLLRLGRALGAACKIAVGFLLPMLCFQRISTRKEWGRYALSTSLFFAFTFAFGGAIMGGAELFSLGALAKGWVLPVCGLLFVVGARLIKKLYRKREDYRHIYPCTLRFKEKKAEVLGFLDSGNGATKEGIPVCFLSADIFYQLCGEELLNAKERGQVCVEIAIATLAGEKTLSAIGGELCIKDGRKVLNRAVYFALSTNMIGREYKLLLHSRILGDEL